MSLPVSPGAAMPEDTDRGARAVCPKGDMCIRMRDELDLIDSNPQEADRLSHTGPPADAPARLALVLVMPPAKCESLAAAT